MGFELNSTLEPTPAVRRLLSPTARLLSDLDAFDLKTQLEPGAEGLRRSLEADGVSELGDLNLPASVQVQNVHLSSFQTHYNIIIYRIYNNYKI